MNMKGCCQLKMAARGKSQQSCSKQACREGARTALREVIFRIRRPVFVRDQLRPQPDIRRVQLQAVALRVYYKRLNEHCIAALSATLAPAVWHRMVHRHTDLDGLARKQERERKLKGFLEDNDVIVKTRCEDFADTMASALSDLCDGGAALAEAAANPSQNLAFANSSICQSY